MKVLYLVHRIPFPPDKGDKIRSFHWLKALASRHEVHLATLYDDPSDAVHREALEEICASVALVPLSPKRARLRSLKALWQGGPLSVPYFDEPALKSAVASLAERIDFDAVVAYSAPMAAYRNHERLRTLPFLMDMVDVDSAKFDAYGESAGWPKRSIYALEGRRLARYEEKLARDSDLLLLCTEPEADLLRDRSGAAGRLEALPNGVSCCDAQQLADDVAWSQADEAPPRFVFVGAMDYFANEDAVVFAAEEIMPRVREIFPDAQFDIVGRHPTDRVRALDARPGVTVHGGVPEVGSYLRSATASLVPLRIAQGIQNKVLEAMAWQIPVLTHPKIVRSLGFDASEMVLSAEAPEDYANQLVALARDRNEARRLGKLSRQFVAEHYAWQPNYERLLGFLEEIVSEQAKTSTRTAAAKAKADARARA